MTLAEDKKAVSYEERNEVTPCYFLELMFLKYARHARTSFLR